jgi:hypothetical protein
MDDRIDKSCIVLCKIFHVCPDYLFSTLKLIVINIEANREVLWPPPISCSLKNVFFSEHEMGENIGKIGLKAA